MSESDSYGMSVGVGGKMPHSHSTPAGVDGGGSRTPPATPRKAGKMLAFRVQMLDDSVTMFQVQVSVSFYVLLLHTGSVIIGVTLDQWMNIQRNEGFLYNGRFESECDMNWKICKMHCE